MPDCVYLYIRVGTGLLRCVRGGGGALGRVNALRAGLLGALCER